MAATWKTQEQFDAIIAEESIFARAAAEWVAAVNSKPESGVTRVVSPTINGGINPMCEARWISGVTFAVVGDYFYSEHTMDPGGPGLKYTLWARRVVAKGEHKGEVRYAPTEMEIRWYEDYNAGRFIAEACLLLKEKQ